MNAELDTRLKAFNRSAAVLALPEHTSIWENKVPEIFTLKHEEATAMLAVLAEAAKKQETALSGLAQEKDREETELEDAAFMLA